MPAEPIIEMLSYKRRKRFFWLLVLIFVVTLPTAIFYTTGYRISYVDDSAVIMTTGGLYVNTDSVEVELWVNELPVRNARLFRSAYYIQNIEAGLHRVVAQQPGLYTWVKQVPVDPYLVTEATAFNFPLIPQIRLITEYETATGTALVLPSQLSWLEGVSTTPPYVISTTTSTSTFVENQEYDVLVALFTSSTTASTSKRVSLLEVPEVPLRFRFSTSGTEEVRATTTQSVTRDDVRLTVRGGEIYAEWIGSIDRIPQYYCVSSGTASTTIARYGQHVYNQVTQLAASTTPPWQPDATRLCRPDIQIDRKQQPVYFMDVIPGRTDIVLLVLADGLYASEIDDWSWQNTQRLYGSASLRVVVENGRIYVADGDIYFEILLELIE